MSADAPIRVLIVDDAATIRSALKIMIRHEPDMEVVGAAVNGMDAVRLAAETRPDIVLMDIEMPVMDGIDATEAIMDTNPVPILIFSSVAEEAAPRTLEALGRGAVDFITKDGTTTAVDIGRLREKLLAKIREFGRRRPGIEGGRNPSHTIVRNRQRATEYRERRAGAGGPLFTAGDMPDREAGAPMVVREMPERLNLAGSTRTMRLIKRPNPRGAIRLVCVGASTGGPQAVQALVSAVPSTLAVPIVVVQHMPASFIGSFAKRLANSCHARVRVGADGDVLQAGTVYVAPGGVHARIIQRAGLLVLQTSAADLPGVLNKPSVDVLLNSVADELGGECAVVILSGMGRDGAAGARRLHGLGAMVLAQDEASSVVYGMPRAVVEDGIADIVLPIEELGDTMLDIVWKGTRRGGRT
jgi:two-component system chemotaxis response regulator CheB